MSDLLAQFGLEMNSLIEMRETKERIRPMLAARLLKSEQYLSEVLAQ